MLSAPMLRVLQKIRLVILLVIGVPALLFVGGMAVNEFVNGKGKLVLVASAPLTFTLDGAAPQTLTAGEHRELTVEQGKHVLSLESELGKGERLVDVTNGMQRFLVPADEGQCFVLLDVLHSHFTFGSDPADPHPRLKQRIKATDLFDLPGSGVYFSERGLPSSIKEDSTCLLLVEAECDELGKDDEALLKGLGY